ncbi:hypothetical protein JNW88_14490, partial [Micromonospora sp. ATA32]|nr:hypothetical protein [Micromonospora sp. ATA32]
RGPGRRRTRGSRHPHPSCTYVSAIVAGDAVTVSWIGDSRAYWLGLDEALLTLDDSLRARVAAGLPVPAALAEEDPPFPSPDPLARCGRRR